LGEAGEGRIPGTGSFSSLSERLSCVEYLLKPSQGTDNTLLHSVLLTTVFRASVERRIGIGPMSEKILGSPATHGVFIPHEYLHAGTKRTRSQLDPIQNYYPPAISLETFEDVQRLRGTAYKVKPRTGHMTNLFGGLATCPIAPRPWTRVNKGSGIKSGKPKLVCTKAKAGAGCVYRGVNSRDSRDCPFGAPRELYWQRAKRP
jgi:hypothetical protein